MTDSNESLKYCNNIEVLRALQSVRRTAQGSDYLPFGVFKECFF
jgi:hypothetical protein